MTVYVRSWNFRPKLNVAWMKINQMLVNVQLLMALKQRQVSRSFEEHFERAQWILAVKQKYVSLFHDTNSHLRHVDCAPSEIRTVSTRFDWPLILERFFYFMTLFAYIPIEHVRNTAAAVHRINPFSPLYCNFVASPNGQAENRIPNSFQLSLDRICSRWAVRRAPVNDRLRPMQSHRTTNK